MKRPITKMKNIVRLLYVLMQRYTFWSNSQRVQHLNIQAWVVRANAKIHILKQFTTKAVDIRRALVLYVLMQRYTFWSNSQRQFATINRCKVVRANAKIHILKQFTTCEKLHRPSCQLYVLMQRYTFWGNSQQRNNSIYVIQCCVYSNARYT